MSVTVKVNLVDEVELLQANPNYAHVRFPDGRESTVSTRHLAPTGELVTSDNESTQNSTVQENGTESVCVEDSSNVADEVCNQHPEVVSVDSVPVRRSERVRRPPTRLDL